MVGAVVRAVVGSEVEAGAEGVLMDLALVCCAALALTLNLEKAPEDVGRDEGGAELLEEAGAWGRINGRAGQGRGGVRGGWEWEGMKSFLSGWA